MTTSANQRPEDILLGTIGGGVSAPAEAPTRLERIMAEVQHGYTPGRTRIDRVMSKIKPRAGEYAKAIPQSFGSAAVEGVAGLIEAPSRARRFALGENQYGRSTDRTLGEAAGEWLRRQAQSMRPTLVEASQPEDTAGKVAKFLSSDVPAAAGSTAAAASGGLLAAAAGIPPWVGVAASGAAANGAAAAYEAQAMGASPDQQWTAFWTNAAVGTTEAVPVAGQIGRILGRADKLSGGWLRKALIEGGEELAQETVQQTAGNWIAQAVAGYDEDRKLLEGVAEGGAAGGLSGMILSALSGVRLRRSTPIDAAPQPSTDVQGVDLTGESAPMAEQLASVEGVVQNPLEPQGTQGAPSSPPPETPSSGLHSAAAPISLLQALSEANQSEVREVAAPDTPEATYVREFAEQRGLRPVFVEGAGRVHGASVPGYIAVDVRSPMRSVAYHETVHQLDDIDGLAADLRALDPEGSAAFEQRYAQNYQEATGAPLEAALRTEEGVALRAEMNAGMLYEALQRPERLRAVLEGKPGAWTRVVDAVIRALQRVGVGVRTSRQRALDAIRAEVAGQDASKALDSETAARVALRIAEAFETLQPATVAQPQAAPTTVAPGTGATGGSARATPAASPIVVAEMPKGRRLGTDLIGEPVYEKEERGPVQRPGAGIPEAKVTQPGIFDEVGGLYEEQAYQAPPEPTRKELLRNKAIRAEFAGLESEVGTEGVGGQIVRGESDQLGAGKGAVIGRTRKAARSEWWNGRPGETSPAHVRRAIRKALNEGKLDDQESATVDYLLREAASRVSEAEFQSGTPEAQKERAAMQKEGRNRKVPGVPFSVAYHGSPYDFDEFRSDKIGTGEGAQAFGHGLYFTDSREIAEHYRKKLSGGAHDSPQYVAKNLLDSFKGDKDKAVAEVERRAKYSNIPGARERWDAVIQEIRNGTPAGRLFEVDLAPAEDEYLLWDKPLSEQSEKVRNALSFVGVDQQAESGNDAYQSMAHAIQGETMRGRGPHMPIVEAKAEVSRRLRAAGIRGIKYLAGDGSRAKQDGTYNYVIFDPADVKVRAKYSVAPNSSFDQPDDNARRKLTRSFLNSFEAIEAAEKAAPNKVGATTATQLRPGKAAGAVERLQETITNELTKVVRKVGRKRADDFVYALHAPRRNEIIAARHPRKHGSESNPGSGMTTSEANKIVAAALASPEAAEFRRIRRLNRQLNRARLDILEGGGLIDSETRKAWEEFGEDYVPLRTALEPDEAHGVGAGLAVSGKESKRAEGRASRADSPLAFGLASAQEAAMRAARNEAANSWAELVKQNPSPVWRIETDRNKVGEREAALSFKDGGQQSYIVTSDQALANAFGQLDIATAGTAGKILQAVSNYLHAVIIRYNPVFSVGNVVRDIGLAATKSGITNTVGMGAQITRDAIPAARGAWSVIRGRDGGEWGKAYREMRDAGGLVAWTGANTFESNLKKLDGDGPLKERVKALGQTIEDFNRALETGTRLATYKAARDRGASRSDAAKLARDVTVDFARRGNWSGNMNRLFMFFNANVQGSAGVLKAMAAHPRRASTAVAALMATGYLLSAASRVLGGDDERTGKPNWDLVPEYEKTKKIGVMVDGIFYGIPAPWGFNVFLRAGGILEDGGGMDDVMHALVDAFSPVQGANILQSLTPTVARPFVEVDQNKTFSDRPIMPAVSPFDRTPPPDSQRAFKSVSPVAKSIAEGLNSATGGNEVRPGAVDISPETLEHFAKFAAGGIGTNVGRVVEQVRRIVNGEPVPASGWPVVRTFVSDVPESAIVEPYYDTLTRIETATEEHKKLGRTSDPKALALSTAARSIDSRVKAARKAGNTELMYRIMGQLLRRVDAK